MDFDITLQPKQEELWRLVDSAPQSWIGFGGARGGTKSHGGRMAMLMRRLKYPGTRGLIIRRKKKELVENHIEPLFKQFPDLRKSFNCQTNTLTLPNQSAIVFGYAEHPAHDQQGDIYDFQGAEFADILVDEATHFNEEELTFLKTCNRWTGGGFIPKMIMSMNPGGRGHVFCKRIFIDREYHDNEKPEHYAFIRAFAWDNVEWSRDALVTQGAKPADYTYNWNDIERRNFFLHNSDYGRNLNSLKGKMRLAHLFGDWEAFAGQFFDIFEPEIGGPHVKPAHEIQPEPWWPKWISIDWGYEHPSAVYWHTQESTSRTVTYRELIVERHSPPALAQEILERTTDDKISAVYLSPDAYAKRTSDDTIARQLDRVLASAKLPSCSKADDDRIGGWMLMYQLLESESWVISSDCRQLIATLPVLIRDDNNREDVLKVPGDDAADSVRYGLKSRLSPRQEPLEQRVEKRIHASDPTSVMIWRSKFAKEERKKIMPIRFGSRFARGRPLA